MALRQTIRFCVAQDRTRLAYATSGTGPSLVKASNYLSHLEFDLRSPVWGHLFDVLSQRFSVLRYDQRGTGLSDRDVSDISFEAWVNDLEAVVDAAGADRFALLGLSQGASVAIAYTVRHPEKVSHLILHGGFTRGRRRRGDPSLVEIAETMTRLAELGWGGNDAAFRQFFTSQFIPRGTPEQHDWFNELERVSTSPQTAARIMRAFDEVDVTPFLAQISCPTLVLHSTGDKRVPFAEGRALALAIPQARFVPLDSENHLMLEQDPEWPRWVDEITEFIGHRPSIDGTFAALTPRERELVELIARGWDNAQIGVALKVSDKTVRNHITSIFAKLQVENRSQAIVMARDAGYGKG